MMAIDTRIPKCFVYHKGTLHDTQVSAQKAANATGAHQQIYRLVRHMEPGAPIHYIDDKHREWHLFETITPDPTRRNAGR